jgi:hypothetical protein
LRLSREEYDEQAKRRAIEAGHKLAAFKARRAALRALGFKCYEGYLESEHWRSFRRLVFEAQRVRLGLNRNVCESCSSSKDEINLQLHHLTYERMGNGRIEDVRVICRECHQKVHGIKSDPREVRGR